MEPNNLSNIRIYTGSKLNACILHEQVQTWNGSVDIQHSFRLGSPLQTWLHHKASRGFDLDDREFDPTKKREVCFSIGKIHLCECECLPARDKQHM